MNLALEGLLSGRHAGPEPLEAALLAGHEGRLGRPVEPRHVARGLLQLGRDAAQLDLGLCGRAARGPLASGQPLLLLLLLLPPPPLHSAHSLRLPPPATLEDDLDEELGVDVLGAVHEGEVG